jgi:hypothetical protein
MQLPLGSNLLYWVRQYPRAIGRQYHRRPAADVRRETAPRSASSTPSATASLCVRQPSSSIVWPSSPTPREADLKRTHRVRVSTQAGHIVSQQGVHPWQRFSGHPRKRRYGGRA